MKRVAFTIILNGLHHLKHNDYYKFMIDNFDLWVIAEGAVESRGSTSWCKKMPDNLHKNGRSVDGTLEFLTELSDNPKVEVIICEGLWTSKDEQVNAAIEVIKEKTNNSFLWQIDCDEQWSLENIELAEKTLLDNNLNSAAFPAHSWLGQKIVAKGERTIFKSGKSHPKWYADAFALAKTPSERRNLRSKTFQGMAQAMANQWTKNLL